MARKKNIRNRKTDKALKTFSIFAVFLCLGAIVGGYLFVTSSGTYYKFEKSVKVDISTVDDMIALGETIYNDELILADDIHITDKDFSIGTEERPFAGTFNGNGHTVYFDFTDVTEGGSLFGSIEEGGIIKNTNFVFNNITVDGSTYAGIAKVNYGTIQDCTISCSEFALTKDRGLFSPTVVINKGTIKNVVVTCHLTVQTEIPDEKLISFGSLCAYNYGTVENSIAVPKYEGFISTDEFKILVGDATNIGISAICAVTMSGGTTRNSAMLLDEGVYTSDKAAALYSATDRSDIFNTDMIFDTLDFDNRFWTFSETDNILSLTKVR